MSVYAPDMRVMRRISQTSVYVSHASYKTEKGAQALCQKLLKRKPKCSYHVRPVGDLFFVYATYQGQAKRRIAPSASERCTDEPTLSSLLGLVLRWLDAIVLAIIMRKDG